MNKQEIDIYLKKINEAQNDTEKLSITRDFLDLIYKSIGFVNQYGNARFLKNSDDIINYLVETGCVSIINEIGAEHILALSHLMGEIVNRSNVPNKESEAEKINNHVDELLSKPELLPENPTNEQFCIYDFLLLRSINESLRKNTPITEKTKFATKSFFYKLPDSTGFRKTILYTNCILNNMQEREDVRDLIPRLSIEEYREMIGLQDENSYYFDYDDLVNEYLSFYGESGEIDIEEKERLFLNIVKKFGAGKLIDSNTYSKYFMNTDTRENVGFIHGKRSIIMRDVLARIFESDGTEFRTIDSEKEYFEMFFLPYDYKTKNGDEEVQYTYDGEFQEMLSDLFKHDGEYWDDVAKYSIRLKNIFDHKNRPSEPFLAKVYDHIRSLDIYDNLKENLNPEKLKEVDPNETPTPEELFKMAEVMGIPYTEEERKIKIDFYNEMKDSGYNPNVTRRGLRRIDAADIALSLMLEFDPTKAISEFDDIQNVNSYSQYGRNIHDSRASRKVIEMYVDNKFANPEKQVEPLIKQIVNQITANPNFNIFNEREISELLQIGYLEKSEFGKEMLNLVRTNLAKNPSYQISDEEARNNVNEFIKKIGTNPIGIEDEAEFDNFLTSLTQIRINSKDGIMPEEVVEFLISQSLRTDSIINIKNDKYEKVPERAIEDLGKIDITKRYNKQKLEYIYKTRDYIGKDNVAGQQRNNSKSVTVKTSMIKRMSRGDLEVLDTVFHENTHAIRAYKMNYQSEEYMEYLMKKEMLIEQTDSEYYRRNYQLHLEEIEAREMGARLTAEYVGKIISKSQVLDLASSLRQNIAGTIINKFEEQRKRYSRSASIEYNSYRKGVFKKDTDGQTRTINEIFDKKVQENKINLLLFTLKEPMARYEYNPLGQRLTFPQQIIAVTNTKSDDEKELDFIRSIINYSGTSKDADALQTLVEINDLIDTRGAKDSNRSKFIAQIIGHNLPDIISRYGKAAVSSLKGGQKPTDEMIEVYSTIQDIIQKIQGEPGAEWSKGFMQKNSKGKHSLELMCTYCDAMRYYYPQIDEDLKAQKQPPAPPKEKKNVGAKIKDAVSAVANFFGYRNYSKVKADIKGKNAAKEFEDDLKKKQEETQKRTEIS